MTMQTDIETFILVGGFGTRLKSVVSDRPKPMAQVNDKPFLELLIEWLVKQDLSNITLLTHFDSEKISNYFKDGGEFNARIRYVQEPTPLGTGGAILNALRETGHQGRFLLLNGDSFIDLDLKDFVQQNQNNDFALALSYQEDCSRYGTVEFDQDNNLISFLEKDPNKRQSYINAGVYLSNGEVLSSLFPEISKLSLETDLIPKLIQQNKKIKVFQSKNYFIDIGLPESYQAFIEYQKRKV